MSLATPVRDKERLPLRVLGVGGGIEAVALHFARFCDEGECGRIAFLDDAFDGVDLFAAHHTHQHFVFLTGVVAYAVHYGHAAVHFAGDMFRDLVMLVGDDVEHQRGLEAGLQHVRDLRGGELREEGIDHGREHRSDDRAGVAVIEILRECEAAGSDDDNAVAHENEPLHVGDGVLGIDEFADDVRAAEGGVVAQHEAEAYAGERAACERSKEFIAAFRCFNRVLRHISQIEHSHEHGVDHHAEHGVESEFFVQNDERRYKERDVEDERGDCRVEHRVRKVRVEWEHRVVEQG